MAIAQSSAAETREGTAGYRGGLSRTLVQTLLLFTFIPLALMGGAAYLRARTLLQTQVIRQMSAQIVNQAEVVNRSVKAKEIRLDRMVRSPAFVAAAQRALTSSSPGAKDLARGTMNEMMRTVTSEGGLLSFSQYFLMNPSGTIVVGGKPEWDGLQMAGSPAYQQLLLGDRISYAFYDLKPVYPNQMTLLTVSRVRDTNGTLIAMMVGVTESGELQNILQNIATIGSGAEARFITADGMLVGTDPYTNEFARLQFPEKQLKSITAALTPMMGKPNTQPATVQFTDEAGARFLGQVFWLESLHTGILYSIKHEQVFGALTSLIPFTILIILASLAAMGVVISLGTRRVFAPLVKLADITKKFSEGDFSQRAVTNTRDEIGLLGQSFNHMAEELSSLYRSLEERVEERTRQMRTAADVAERLTSTTNLGDLLNRTAQLLIEQFNFYQVSIFLVDRGQRYALLRASAGPAASELLSRGHRLEVGSASIVGWVTANNQPRIASDVAEDPIHQRNELLPETRSEAGIPIRAGNTVLGVLDVQSKEPRAFSTETVVMLQTLANQIAAAIQNMTLAEASQTNMQELERLYRQSRRIVGSLSEDQALTRAGEMVAAADYPSILLTVAGSRLQVHGTNDPAKPVLTPLLNAVPVLEANLAEVKRYVSGGPVIAEASSLGLPLALLEFTRQVGHRAIAFLPINHREELAGIIIVGSPGRPLSMALIDPYASLADLIGVTLDRLAETQEIERRLMERDSLTKISQASMQSSDDLGSFFAELHAQVRRNIGEYPFAVALYNVAHESISLPYSFQEGRVQQIPSFPLGDGLNSILIRSGQPLLLAEDVERRASRLGAKTVGRIAKSWMGVPLMAQGAPIGALIIQDPENEHSFDDRNLSFFTEMANQVASVVHSAQQLDESRRHTLQLEATAEIAKDMSGSLNLDELLLKVVNYLRDRLGFYHAAVFLLDAKRENAVIREATGDAGVQLKRSGHKLSVNSRSIVGFVAGRGEPLIVSDTTKDATYYQNPLLPDTRSEAAVPLRVGERIVGVMDVQSNHPNAFQQEDLRTLQILADQLAVAVVNSELFAETQELLSQHRLLQHITTTAASGTTLDEALDGAVTGLQVTLGGDRVSILLLDRENRNLEIRASVGYSEEIRQLRIPVSTGITGWSASHGRTLRVDDVTTDPRYVEGSPNTRSELAVPLIYRNEVLGVLNVESEEPAAYNENDEEMLATLAGSLAAVIANARLLEQVRAQAERERALFEITGKIRRAPDIQSILATTASELTRVVGARRAQIKVSTERTNGEAPKEE